MSTASGDSPQASPEVQRYRPRACQSCARSKMRCVWPSEPGATPCHRCAKIRVPCTLPEVNPRRRRGPSTNKGVDLAQATLQERALKIMRVGQLEEKIDGIMSLLNASQHIQQNSQTPPPESNRSGIQSLLNPEVETTRSERPGLPEPEHPYLRSAQLQEAQRLLESRTSSPRTGRAASDVVEVIPGLRMTFDEAHQLLGSRKASPPAGRTPAELIEIVPGFSMTFDEADRALNLYRSVYIHHFPFVPVPSLMTAYEFYNRSPFLFRAVVSVTAPQSPITQKNVKQWFRQFIAEHVVVQQQRRLELLQGLLVFLAWGEHHFYIESQATNFLHLAVALAVDLGLNRPANPLGLVPYSVVHEAVKVVKIGRHQEDHSLDDMRAMLGCFYMYSVASTLFRRMENRPFTSHMAKCCDALEKADEYDTDKLLVALVRMQRLVIRVFDIFPNPEMEVEPPRIFHAPLQMSIIAIRKELDVLIQSQPPEVERNVLLAMYYHGTLTRLYEPSIYMRSSLSSNDSAEVARRIEALWGCLQSAKDFFAAYVAIPPDTLGSLPFVATAHMSFVIVTTSRILFLEDPDWDVGLARRYVDLAAICDQLAERYDEGDRMAQTLGRRRKFMDLDTPTLGKYRDKIRWIRNWYLSRTTTGLHNRSRQESSAAGTAAAAKDPTSLPGTSGMPGQDGGSSGGGSGGGGGGGGGAGVGRGHTMDLDQPTQAQATCFPSPDALDEAFWQALLDSDGRVGWAGWVEQ